MFNLYSVQGNGDKVFLASYASLAAAQAAMTNVALTYSIEKVDKSVDGETAEVIL